MAYELTEGQVGLFRNEKKEPGSKQPDMRGNMLWKGEKIKLSMWTKGEGDKRFLSGLAELDDYVKPVATGDVAQDELPF